MWFFPYTLAFALGGRATLSAAMSAPAMTSARFGVLLGVLGGIPHWPALSAGFVNWDDDRFISNNPLFAGPIGAYIAAALTRVQFEAYQPLHLLSYLPDRLLWAHHPAGFHAVNLVLFSLGVGLLATLLGRHVPQGPAAVASLAFAWHPLLVEPVAWVSARKDLLALVLVVALLHAEDRAGPARPQRWLSLLLSAAAVLAKSAAVVAPVLVFAWQRYVRGRPLEFALGRAALPAVPALLAAFAVNHFWQTGQMIGPRPLPAAIDVAGTIGVYALRIVWPHDLAATYPPLLPGQAVAGVAVLIGLLLALAFWRHLGPSARFALLAGLGALVPVANLVPLYFRFADRYALFALLTLTWPLAVLLSLLVRHPGPSGRAWPALVMSASLAVLLVEAAVSLRAGRAWQGPLQLWSHARAAQPRSFHAALKLGETERTRGQWASASRAYLGAIALDPSSVLGFAGLILSAAGQAEAEGKLTRGQAATWLERLGPALHDRSALSALVLDSHAAGCPRCAQALQWLELRRFPRPDAELVRAAELALQYGEAAMALVFIEQMRNRSGPDHARLSAAARARLGPPSPAAP